MVKHTIVTGLLCCFFSTSLIAQNVINIPKVTRDKEKLSFEVLKLALHKAGLKPEFNQATQSHNMSRLMSDVEAGKIDVIWAGASPDKDRRLRAVRIPILKGMMGYKLFVIRNNDQSLFSNVSSLESLKYFKAGQKLSWADTKILKEAGLPTVTSVKYPNLFDMLEGGRFDYFPRGLLDDPWQEASGYKHLNLKVEDRLMLAYPHAMYFYINKQNDALYKAISNGFELAIQDGSFDELFFNNNWVKQLIDKSDLKNRVVFKIDNTSMHKETPYQRSEYWLDISNL